MWKGINKNNRKEVTENMHCRYYESSNLTHFFNRLIFNFNTHKTINPIIHIDLMTFYKCLKKLIFAQFQVKPILTQPVQHCQDVPQVASLVRAMNQDVIHVHLNKWEPVKHRCHHPLEGTGCIGQTHRHDQPFVVSILCPKRGTLYTVRGHA